MALELVDDLRYSILELNAHAMQRSQVGELVEAQQLLEAAYIRLQSADAAILAADAGLVDQLKATTLSNLGVVECHKRELDKSLDHLEAALAIEKRIGLFSPTTALNLCATFNALGRYEEAVDICAGAVSALMATNNGVPTEENKTLWAAAWHNLSVAEMNLGGDHGGHDDRRIAVLNMFRNAMRASIDLLGPKHSLTATIHESYRAARPLLKKQGAYKIRDGLLPMLSASANVRTLEKRRELMTQTLTEDEKLGSAPAFEGALAGHTGAVSVNRSSHRVPSLLTAVRNAQRGDAFRPTHTLVRAQPLYLGQHPATVAAPKQSEAMLRPRQRELRRQMIPSIAPAYEQQRQQQQQQQQRAYPQSARPAGSRGQGGVTLPPMGNGGAQSPTRSARGSGSPARARFNPATNKVLSSLTSGGGNASAGDAGLSWSATGPGAPKRTVEQALIGDMWVEVEVPMARRLSPPTAAMRAAAIPGAPALRQPGGVAAGAGAWPAYGGGGGAGEFRAPAYGQAMHVIEPSDPIMERVSHPSTFAAIDVPYYAPFDQQQQQQQQGRVAPASGAPARPPPQVAGGGAAPTQQPPQQQRAAAFPPSLAQTSHVLGAVQQPQQQASAQSGGSSPAPPPIPQPPKRPASSGSRGAPLSPAAQVAPSAGAAAPARAAAAPPGGDAQFTFIADALGNDIKSYPGLALLASM
jgi:tetratricopeptide (TPR) repeat protein